MIYTDLYKKKRKRCITVKIYDIFERFRQQGKIQLLVAVNFTSVQRVFQMCRTGCSFWGRNLSVWTKKVIFDPKIVSRKTTLKICKYVNM